VGSSEEQYLKLGSKVGVRNLEYIQKEGVDELKECNRDFSWI
jgi:hypothetical protein